MLIHKHLCLLQEACLAHKCAATLADLRLKDKLKEVNFVLISLASMRTVAASDLPKPPAFHILKIDWESMTIETKVSLLSQARRIPSLTAQASIIIAEAAAGYHLAWATTMAPILSRMIAPVIP